MIKAAISMAAVVLALSIANTASADEFAAMSACHALYQSDIVENKDVGISNLDHSNAVTVFCPLKVYTCSSPPCTLTANAYGVDNNYGTAADSNVSCSLNVALRQTAGTSFPGSPVTIGTVGPMTTMPLSVTMSGAPFTGIVYAKCTISKSDWLTGSSYVTWFDTAF
jgi:hypothetical protein